MKHHKIRILYTQFISFGDVIISTMILRKLKEKYGPDSLIDYFTSSPCAELLTGNPNLNVVYTERFPPKMENYDVILRPYHCLQSSGGWHVNHRHFCDLYADVCGVELGGEYQPEFHNMSEITEELKEVLSRVVFLQARTNDRAKEWSMMNWEKLVQGIKDLGLDPVQIGGKNDPLIPFARPSLGLPWGQVATAMNFAFMTVCLDSAVQHLAAAVFAPYIALYGAKHSSLVRTGVPVQHSRQFAIDPAHRNGCATACYLSECFQKSRCIDNIKPEMVLGVISSLKEKKHE